MEHTWAWYEAEAYGYWCLHEERWIELDKGDKEWCDQICTINTTEISPDNEGKEGILDLVVTDNNPCNNTGVWIPTATSDLSITDLMRVDPGPPDRCLYVTMAIRFSSRSFRASYREWLPMLPGFLLNLTTTFLFSL